MKFILNEKFILDERFILTEAEDNLKKLREQALKAINDNFGDEFFAKIDTETKAGINNSKIIEASKEVKNQLKTDKKDLSVYKDAVHNYTKVLRDEINSAKTGAGSPLNALPDEVTSIIDKLDELVDTPTKDAEEIEAAINDLNLSFSKLDSAVQSSISSDESSEYTQIAEEIKEFKKDRDDLILGINTTLANDATATKEFQAFIKQANNDKISFNGVDQDLNTKDFIKQLSARIKTASGLINNFNKFIAKYPAAKDQESKLHEGTDWETLLKSTSNPKEIKAIWERYFNEEWGSDAEKVKSLGETFIQELLKAGFSEIANPFITFVKNNINKLNLNAETYPAIHNAYVKEYIDDDDLTGADSNNILFNEMLYFNPAWDILDYLKIQHDIETTGKNDITSMYVSWPYDCLLAVFDDHISTAEIQEQKEAGEKVSLSGNLATIVLKNLSKVKEALTVLEINSERIARKTAATDDDVDRIYDQLRGDKQKIWQALLWLNLTYSSETQDLNKLVLNKITDDAGITNDRDLHTDDAPLINKIKSLFKTLTFKNLPEFMLKLAKKAGFKVTGETTSD